MGFFFLESLRKRKLKEWAEPLLEPHVMLDDRLKMPQKGRHSGSAAGWKSTQELKKSNKATVPLRPGLLRCRTRGPRAQLASLL